MMYRVLPSGENTGQVPLKPFQLVPSCTHSVFQMAYSRTFISMFHSRVAVPIWAESFTVCVPAEVNA